MKMEQAAQGGGEITIPGVISKMVDTVLRDRAQCCTC